MDIFSIIFGGLLALTQSWVEQMRNEDYQDFVQKESAYNLPKVETYEFIIVGGGLAGSVLAATLSESHTVLVLEIGGPPPRTTYVPANGPYINHLLDIAYVHSSSPHQFANLDHGGIITVPTGKVLGGGSITNGLVYNRGHPLDYDNWANITNDPSWTYQNLLPIFRAVENYEGEFPIGEQHGIGGPVTISKQNYAPGLSVWLESGRELGYEKEDPNGPQQVGFCPIEFNHKFGRRDSVFDGYLKPLIGTRPNLTVRNYAEAQEILLDPTNSKAIGVLYTRHGKQDQVAYASKEVILSAGVFGSPKILLKSGLGPTEHLIEAGIAQKVNLPVGSNLQEHPGIHIQAKVNASAAEHLYFPERDLTLDSIRQFEETGEGPLTYASWGAIALGFLASSRAEAQGHADWVDIQLALQSHNENAKFEDPNSYIISNYVFNGRPNSRGYLRLNTTDTSLPVDFGFGFFTDPDQDDISVLIEGIRVAVEMFENTLAYQRLGATVVREILPACPSFQWGSDAYWRCFIHQRATGFYHPVGSCSMGQLGDSNAVVDSKLRVFGVSGLRVIDSSIMPQITNSNIQAPTLIIAKKGADDILAFWSQQK